MKIAIVGHMSHEYIGGIENYHRILFEHWKGKHQVTEFPTFGGESTKIEVSKVHKWVKQDYSLMGWKPYNMVYGGTFTKKNFHKIFDNHDVVLLSCPQLPKKWINHPKSIIVQHMNKDWYTLGGKPFHWSLGQFFASSLFGAGTFKNSFKNAKKTMFYAPEARGFTKGKSFYAPLPYKSKKDIKLNNEKREGFVWMARLDQHEKNVKFAVELANKNSDMKIYGAGPAQPIVDKKLVNQEQFGGKLNHDKIDNVLGKARAFLLTSSFEGFGFTVTEALSNGTPAIVFDTFDIARFFKKSDAVFVIKPGDKKAYQRAIDSLRNMTEKEYRKLQENAIAFAKNHLTKESFWKAWDEALATKVGMFENKWAAYDLLKNDVLPVLEKEKIWYSAEAGTMLGAIRHKGFIPWDDDIDLMITYEGFLKLQSQYPDNILSTDDKGYPLLFPKWVEDKGLMNSSIPAIDLFIIVPTTKKKVKKFHKPLKVLRFGIQTLNKSDFVAFAPNIKAAKLFQKLFLPFLWKKMSIHKVARKLTVPVKEADGYYLIENPTQSYEKKYNPLSVLETKKMKFEKININVSKAYDEILTHRYNKNYMEPYIGKYVFNHISPISIELIDGKEFKKEK